MNEANFWKLHKVQMALNDPTQTIQHNSDQYVCLCERFRSGIVQGATGNMLTQFSLSFRSNVAMEVAPAISAGRWLRVDATQAVKRYLRR